MKKLLIIIITIFTFAQPQASFSEQNHNSKINEITINVHGIVCSFCSVGVRKKLNKLPFIDTSKYKDGIKVDIDNQKVIIAINPKSKLDISAIYKSITSGGYEIVNAKLTYSDGTVLNYDSEGK